MKKIQILALVLLLALTASTALPARSSSMTEVDETVIADTLHKVNQGAPVNRIVVEMTYDTEKGTYSLGGFTAEQLRVIGAPQVNGEVMTLLKRIENAHLAIDAQSLAADINGQPLATVNWDPLSRRAIFDLAGEYGLHLDANVQERAEGWLDVVDVDITIRQSSQVSQPLLIQLDTPLQVDVAKTGRLVVEGVDTGMAMYSEVVRLARAGSIQNTTVCWNEGALTADLNGSELPSVTVHREGLEVLDQALGLRLGNKEPFFNARAGVNIAFNGSGHPESASCGD
jgi:hypothetical protein